MYMLINRLCHTKSELIFFVYQKSLKRTFKTGFWVQNHFLNLFSSTMNSQRFFVQPKNWCEMFELKLSGIQMVIKLQLKVESTQIMCPCNTSIKFFKAFHRKSIICLIKKKLKDN